MSHLTISAASVSASLLVSLSVYFCLSVCAFNSVSNSVSSVSNVCECLGLLGVSVFVCVHGRARVRALAFVDRSLHLGNLSTLFFYKNNAIRTRA